MRAELSEPVIRLLRHPESGKVLSAVSPEGYPHTVVLGALVVGEDGRIYAGDVFMKRIPDYLERSPKAEILVWKGKYGYSIRAVCDGRVTEGPEFDRMNELLGRLGMRAGWVWAFTPQEVWDESASPAGGTRVRWTRLGPGGSARPSPSYRRSSSHWEGPYGTWAMPPWG